MQPISIGLPKGVAEQHDTYKGCTLGKYTKATFHDKDSRAQEVMESVHSDVCGPFSTMSTTKNNDYDVVVNEFSCE